MKTRIGRIFWEEDTGEETVKCTCHTNMMMHEGKPLIIDLHPRGADVKLQNYRKKVLKPQTSRLYEELGYIVGLDNDFLVQKNRFYIGIILGLNMALVRLAVAEAMTEAFDLTRVDAVAERSELLEA